MRTRSQSLSQEAYVRAKERKKAKAADYSEYETVARRFPALIHTCGLAQAVAFAQSKHQSKVPGGGTEHDYLADLASVLNKGGHGEVTSADALANEIRTRSVATYLRLSRDSIDAAVWLKRYAEALSEDCTPGPVEVKS